MDLLIFLATNVFELIFDIAQQAIDGLKEIRFWYNLNLWHLCILMLALRDIESILKQLFRGDGTVKGVVK